VSVSAPNTVAWIGLGEMGLPMASNLVAAGHRVLGFDVDVGRLAAAADLGIEAAASATGASVAADVVVTMLRTGAQTEALLAGDDGLAAAVSPARRLVVVVMSTLEPDLMRRLADATAGCLTLVDAPVSGGVRGAEAGTLAIMAAGPPDSLARVRPLFDVLGESTFELGTVAGTGQAAKLANQVMMAASLAGTLEALDLSRTYGLEDDAVCAAVAAGTGASWVLDHWEWMRSLWEQYLPGNALDILIKDLRATVEAAIQQRVEVPVSALALSRLLEERDRPAVQSSWK
jgi:3-hydroxyisobutyrate dehydrogenase-like beta-hydroxyacid dehydrogenase